MPTNLALDDDLIRQAVQIGSHRTKKAAVTAALVEYVGRRERLRVRALFGEIDFDSSFDHKAERRRNDSR